MIDLIIPVYNSRKTLPYTLMSVSLQTVKDKFRVYIIDDCSSESYDDILDEFRDDFEIVYCKLRENKGAGLARQKGLDISNNKYIIFLDSDDLFYNSDSVRLLYEEIDNNNYDIVSGWTYDEKYKVNICHPCNLHAKIYRREFIEKNSICFIESRYHEDNYFNSLVNMCSPKSKIIDDVVHIYSDNPISLTNDDKDFERLDLYLDVALKGPFREAKKRKCDFDMVFPITNDRIKYLRRLYNESSDDKKDKMEVLLTKDYDLFKYLFMSDEEVKKDMYIVYINEKK